MDCESFPKVVPIIEVRSLAHCVIVSPRGWAVAHVLIALREPNTETGKHLERMAKITEIQQAVLARVTGEQFTLTHRWEAISALAGEIASPQALLQGTSKISKGKRSSRRYLPSVSPCRRQGYDFLSHGVISQTHPLEMLGGNVPLNAYNK
jgi:hypothetical protein